MSYGASFIPQIIEKLFEKDQQRFDDLLEKLIEDHRSLGGSPHGFLFMGKFWTLLDHRQQKQAQKNFLHKSLHERGQELCEMIKTGQNEKTILVHGLGFLLREAKDLQDVRDVLPDTASMVIPELSPLSRTRPEAYHIRDKALTMHTYNKISEIFDFYAANQLIY